jgi:hypothetical protein
LYLDQVCHVVRFDALLDTSVEADPDDDRVCVCVCVCILWLNPFCAWLDIWFTDSKSVGM